jgi:hypothetical protein
MFGGRVGIPGEQVLRRHVMRRDPRRKYRRDDDDSRDREADVCESVH